jgi:hypothetical protein
MLLTIGLCSALALSANAAEPGKKRQLTEEQKTVIKELTDKYDKDKDGKLSPDERKAMSAEDRQKMRTALGRTKKEAK